ncbi:MAG TPA: CHAT domain-containing protein [Longimicrobium sp.]
MKRKFLLPALAVLLCVAVAAVGLSVASARRSLLGKLAHAKLERSFAPRLSIPTRYQECTAQPTDSAATVPRETCGTSYEGSLPLLKFDQAGGSVDPDSLQGSGLKALIFWGDDEESLDEAIERLTKALRLSTRPVPLLVDLSAAYLVRADRTQNPIDLLRGMDFAYEALAREPRNAEARFNAALALQAFGLDEQAALEWKAFLAIDSTSPWGREAQRRMGELIPPLTPTLARGASPAEVSEFARAHPQQARELGFNDILGEWGTAVERGENARADSLLDFADALGRALAGREGGDASLFEAVGAIRDAASDRAAIARLAQGHRKYTEGQAAFFHYDGTPARVAFTAVIEARPPSRALLQWAGIFQSVSLAYQGDRDGAIRELAPQLSRVDSAHYPALAGRARLLLGTLRTRETLPGAAREHFRTARRYLASAGEADLAASTLTGFAEEAYPRGDTVEAYGFAHRGLQALRRYGRSPNLHKHLVALGRFAAEGEMHYAAWAIYNEDIAVAGRLNRVLDNLEAHLGRANAKLILHDSVGASRDWAAAAAWSNRIPNEDDPRRMWSSASIQLASRERVSAARMDSVVEALSGSNVWKVPAYIWRADQRLALNDSAGAAADLDSVTIFVQNISRQENDLLLRGSVMEQARRFFDRLIMVHLDKRPGEALRTLERSRISFTPRREGEVARGEGRLDAPKGQVALEYALIGDTLLAFMVSDTILVWRQVVDRDSFMLAVEQANVALESARAPVPKRALRQLYRWLIGPMGNHLGGPGTPLIILADGEVAGVPFAALMNGDRYLIQDHSLRFAATLEDAARPPPRRSGAVLLVADPKFDLFANAPLGRLPGASEEVDSLRRIYPEAEQLEDSTATRSAFVAAARRASVIHYAGHAIFNDVRPERSYLLLAGADTTGRLTAETVANMRLEGTRLVVLSACRTLRSRSGRSGGFAGLSGALLGAGAGGVVGSLWEVNDQRTGPLMQAFHEAYKVSDDAARALQAAQIHMLNLGSSPSVWAGFRYTGS